MSIAEKLLLIGENQKKVYDAGYAAGKKNDQSDALAYATIIRFQRTAFPEGYELELRCNNLTELPLFTQSTGIRKITLVVPLNRSYTATNVCYACESVEELVLPDGITISTSNYMCTNAYNLRIIEGALNLTGNTNTNMWSGCRNLEQIRFVAGTINTALDFAKCGKLSDASVASLVSGLADRTGATRLTLQLHPDVAAKLTDEQKAEIASKNWAIS